MESVLQLVQKLKEIISFHLVTAQKQNMDFYIRMTFLSFLTTMPTMDMMHELIYLCVINLLMYTHMRMDNTTQQSARAPLDSRETHRDKRALPLQP